jgi:hypothetical protein
VARTETRKRASLNNFASGVVSDLYGRHDHGSFGFDTWPRLYVGQHNPVEKHLEIGKAWFPAMGSISCRRK